MLRRDRVRRPVAGLLLAVLAAAALVAAAPVALPEPAAAQESLPCDDPRPGEGLAEWVNRCFGPIYDESGGGGGGTPRCELRGTPFGPAPVLCLHPTWGWWSNAQQCYMSVVDPQPAAGHPAWEGNDPADGLIYRMACPYLNGVDGLPWWEWTFLKFFPAGSGELGQLVEEAIGRLPITGPDIHMAPDPAGTGLVGLPVWMWTPVTEATWSPAPLRLPALGWELVVEAHVDRIDWDMGDGTVQQCHHPGTPYEPQHGAAPSPTCGHLYELPSRSQPDGRYQVTATTHWVIRWFFDGTAVGATLTTTRQSSTTVRVNELQVVTS